MPSIRDVRSLEQVAPGGFLSISTILVEDKLDAGLLTMGSKSKMNLDLLFRSDSMLSRAPFKWRVKMVPKSSSRFD